MGQLLQSALSPEPLHFTYLKQPNHPRGSNSINAFRTDCLFLHSLFGIISARDTAIQWELKVNSKLRPFQLENLKRLRRIFPSEEMLLFRKDSENGETSWLERCSASASKKRTEICRNVADNGCSATYWDKEDTIRCKTFDEVRPKVYNALRNWSDMNDDDFVIGELREKVYVEYNAPAVLHGRAIPVDANHDLRLTQDFS